MRRRAGGRRDPRQDGAADGPPELAALQELEGRRQGHIGRVRTTLSRAYSFTAQVIDLDILIPRPPGSLPSCMTPLHSSTDTRRIRSSACASGAGRADSWSPTMRVRWRRPSQSRRRPRQPKRPSNARSIACIVKVERARSSVFAPPERSCCLPAAAVHVAQSARTWPIRFSQYACSLVWC